MKYWTKEELHAYLLIYGMNADLAEETSEVNYTLNKVTAQALKDMHVEYEKDNDIESIRKITKNIEHLGIVGSELDDLLAELKDLFQIDGSYDVLERILYNGLKKILK